MKLTQEAKESREKLKIKHLSMIQEARIIRRRELNYKKWKKRIAKQAAEAKKWQDLSDTEKDAMKGVRMFEYKENRGHNEAIRSSLFDHRVYKNRPIIRAIHLARGYLRNVPYRAMESVAYVSPDWSLVWKHVVKFGLIENTEANQRLFMEWADVPLAAPGPKHNLQHDYTARLSKPNPSILIQAAIGRAVDT